MTFAGRLVRRAFACSPALLLATCLVPACATELRDAARTTLDRAIAYYHGKVASHGGYVYYYSPDLQQRWGEGTATKDQIFVQPPGTPTVGQAFLRAYTVTRDPRHLAAARAAGLALAHGQLESGGWAQVIDFDPRGSKAGRYRSGRGHPKGRNHTSLDDNQTQAAIAFLAELDRALDFRDATISTAARTALDALLAAQFPNGGFPQGFTGPATKHPVRPARFPPDWPRTWPNEPYWNYYTLNDGLAGSVAATLLAAHAVYQDARYDAAVRRLGEFLRLAQMPAPQPAWCQQYDFAMQPVWARRFEPPAISGLESEDAIRTLLRIHRHTGDRRYLEPIPRAIAYLRPKRQPDGLMPRYFELHTDRPLYLHRTGSNYTLTYDDRDLPAHYGWKQPSRLDELEREFAALAAGAPAVSAPSRPPSTEHVRAIVDALDGEGRWLSTHRGERLVGQPKFAPGFPFIDSAVFAHRVELLAQFLAADAGR